jgi:hypothetical protein
MNRHCAEHPNPVFISGPRHGRCAARCQLCASFAPGPSGSSICRGTPPLCLVGANIEIAITLCCQGVQNNIASYSRCVDGSGSTVSGVGNESSQRVALVNTGKRYSAGSNRGAVGKIDRNRVGPAGRRKQIPHFCQVESSCASCADSCKIGTAISNAVYGIGPVIDHGYADDKESGGAGADRMRPREVRGCICTAIRTG